MIEEKCEWLLGVLAEYVSAAWGFGEAVCSVVVSRDAGSAFRQCCSVMQMGSSSCRLVAISSVNGTICFRRI